MSQTTIKRPVPTPKQLEHMHALYRKGGGDRLMALHILYSDPACPHAGCGLRLQAIDFRLETYGRAVHDPLVRAWWNDPVLRGAAPNAAAGFILRLVKKERFPLAKQVNFLSYQTIGIPLL